MRRLSGTVLSVLVAGILAWSTSASAEEHAINLAASIDDAGVLTVTVAGPLPKGLFTQKNQLKRDKSALVVSYDVAASDCLPAAGGSVSAATSGTFIPFLNPKGDAIAYGWTTTIDLSAQQNHWNNHLHCDGSIHTHGCTGARLVSVRATLNTPGDSEWGGDQTDAELGAVQDPDTAETNCCDPAALTTCEAACDSACKSAHDACKDSCDELPSKCCETDKGVKTCIPGCVTKGECQSACGQAHGECHGACNCDCLASTPGCTACE